MKNTHIRFVFLALKFFIPFDKLHLTFSIWIINPTFYATNLNNITDLGHLQFKRRVTKNFWL